MFFATAGLILFIWNSERAPLLKFVNIGPQMEISKDFRRKMIMKLIQAVKESPSFCEISDRQLKEAVLNSENKTYEQSKNKDEYIYYISEKLRKIKQNSGTRFEFPCDEKPGGHMIGGEDEREKIINGNIPPHVKVSQGYAHEVAEGYIGKPRKMEGMSAGYMMPQQMNAGTPDSLEPLNSYGGYGPNNACFEYQKNEYAQENKMYEPKRTVIAQQRQFVKAVNPSYPPRMNKPDFLTEEQEGLYKKMNVGEVPKQTMKTREEEMGIEQKARMKGYYYPGGHEQMGYQQTMERNPYQAVGDREGFYDSTGGRARRMSYMFTSPNGRFKTDAYSDKFGTPFMPRTEPLNPLKNFESDPRLVRNPSFRREPSIEDNERNRRNMQPVSTRTTFMPGMKSTPNNFEYSYGTTVQKTNRSFVGNVNPSLFDQNAQKDPRMDLRPFDEKKSEELFKSFCQEFMKNNTNAPGGLEERNTEDEKIVSSETEETTDEIDGEIPAKLQEFLDKNGLSLKEIKKEAEWRIEFDRVYKKFKELPESTVELASFAEIIAIQKEFLDFPFCDENDLKSWQEELERNRLKNKHNKDDYLLFIDKAIEAFSDMNSDFCFTNQESNNNK